MAVTLANSFEGVATGTTISTSNSASGGNAFDSVTIGSGATVVFSTVAYRGSAGAMFMSGATSAQASCDWTTSLGTGLAHSYGRTYVRATSLTSGIDIMRQRNSTIQAFRLRMNNASKLELRDTGNSVVATSTTTFSLNTWYLIRWDVSIGTSNTGVVYIHTDPTVVTPAETMTASAANFGSANVVQINFGGPVAAAANSAAFYHDDVMATDVALPSLSIQSVNLSESQTGSDSLGTQTVLGRAGSESQTASDSLARTLIHPLAPSETHTATDSIARTALALRAPSESQSASDSPVRQLIRSRTPTETNSASDVLAVQSLRSRSASESLTTSDSVSRARIYVSNVTESLTGSDTLTRAFNAARSPVETDSASDSISRHGIANRSANETTSASDSTVIQKHLQAAVSEPSSTLDSVARHLVATRTASDTNTASDSVTASTGGSNVRAVTESTSTTDGVTGRSLLSRIISDGSTSTDAIQRSIAILRSLMETQSTNDLVSRADVIPRTVSDGSTATDSVVLHRLLNRLAFETLTTTDIIQALRNFYRYPTENTATSDTVSTSTPGTLTTDVEFDDIQLKWNFVAVAGRRRPQVYCFPMEFDGLDLKWDIDWGSVMYAIPAVSREYVRVPVTAQAGGFFINPTSLSVSMAFMTTNDSPSQSDWQSATWDQTASPAFSYVIQCLVGPTAVELPAGTYNVWVQIDNSPELVQRPVGTLTITQGIV